MDDQGRAVEAYLDPAEHYVHGVYRREDARHGVTDTRFIRLSLVGAAFSDDLNDEGTKVSFTSGEVRRLAAALIHIADAADMLDRDLNDAKARRDAREDEE